MTSYESYMNKVAGNYNLTPGIMSQVYLPNAYTPKQVIAQVKAQQKQMAALRSKPKVAPPPAPSGSTRSGSTASTSVAPAGSAPGRTWGERAQAVADFTERLVALKNAPQAVAPKSRGWGLGHTALLGGSVITAGGLMGMGSAVYNQNAYGGL